MQKKIFLYILVLISTYTSAQEKFTISGFVENAKSKERLIGANILTDKMQGVATNKFGYYSLTLPSGTYQVTARFVGFENVTQTVILQTDTVINYQLKTGIEINEIQIKANRSSKTDAQLSSLSVINLNMKQIDRAPVILGERDVLKTLQFMPGIKSGRENTAGFNVRGGSTDQNLILLDGVPVYNVNHLFGFFSVFNNDAIKNVTLYKGGIPARYGGRLSSVLDISMKEGDMKKSHGVFSISPISAKFTFEAPIKKDTAAFIVSLRRTMLDIPLTIVQSLRGDNYKFGYYFYDLNTKASWIINTKNRIYLSLYAGKDKDFSNSNDEGIKDKYKYQWGNITSVFRWNKTISPRLFSNISAYYSRYLLDSKATTTSEESTTSFKTTSELQEYTIKADYDFYISPSNTFRFGGKVSHNIFAPNIIQLLDDGSNVTFNNEYKNNSNSLEMFVENDFRFKDLNLNIGLRENIYNTGEKTYWNLQPRVAIKYFFKNNLSTNISYTNMSQFIHLLSNSSVGMPTDLWVASTDEVKPQESNQISFGIEKQFSNFSFSTEGYYKRMKNIIRFEEGAAFLNTQSTNWSDNISVGQGRAYGLEFMLRKKEGVFTGMLSYTLAWSDRQFDNINRGQWFPHKYDRRHDISLLGEYSLLKSETRERTFTFAFTLQSGNKISIPDVEYEGGYMPGMKHLYYTEDWGVTQQSFKNPNNFKMPLFHHLDLGYNSVFKRKNGKTFTWTFSVYNVYSRLNTWFYYKNKQGKIKEISMFPIIPSVAFKYAF